MCPADLAMKVEASSTLHLVACHKSTPAVMYVSKIDVQTAGYSWTDMRTIRFRMKVEEDSASAQAVIQ